MLFCTCQTSLIRGVGVQSLWSYTYGFPTPLNLNGRVCKGDFESIYPERLLHKEGCLLIQQKGGGGGRLTVETEHKLYLLASFPKGVCVGGGISFAG